MIVVFFVGESSFDSIKSIRKSKDSHFNAVDFFYKDAFWWVDLYPENIKSIFAESIGCVFQTFDACVENVIMG